MASDGRGEGRQHFQGVHLSLALPTEGEAETAFNALAGGGKVDMPLAKTFFAPRFGILTDRFGLGWMIVVAPNSGK
jgi:PhnB protein